MNEPTPSMALLMNLVMLSVGVVILAMGRQFIGAAVIFSAGMAMGSQLTYFMLKTNTNTPASPAQQRGE